MSDIKLFHLTQGDASDPEKITANADREQSRTAARHPFSGYRIFNWKDSRQSCRYPWAGRK